MLGTLVALAFLGGAATVVPFTPLDALIAGVLNAALWYGIAWLFIVLWRLGKRALTRSR